MKMEFDLFVIGGGSGGVRAARIAAQHGARVGIAEGFRFGGTCVIRGCVPKKLLVYASRFSQAFAEAQGFGWQVPPATVDWNALVAAKDKEISRLEAAYAANLDKAGVTRFAEYGEIIAPGKVRLSSGQQVTAREILIATGGEPLMPSADELPGAGLAISSNEVFDLPAFPKRIAVVGGGYVGVEFAGIFNGLGAQVTQIHRGPRVLRGFDTGMADLLIEAYREKGIDMRLNSTLKRLDRGADGSIRVTLNDDSQLDVDQVLIATGRRPATSRLGLASVGVATGRSGEILVDRFGRTSVPGIYAVGDVTGTIALTPVAIREGHAFADTVYGNRPWVPDLRFVPTAIFSTPEMGTVGLNEDEARQQVPVLDIYRASFRTLKATLSGTSERVHQKVLVDASTDRVVGVQLLGPDSGELVQVMATLLKMGVTKHDLDQTMPLHPSSAEELMTMRTPSERVVQASVPPGGQG
ncbi:MAG: glutathione-disulfide reductase [Lautropia sp.]|nr:glutathione-disulfide reductase [Lautropia sp.]